MRKGRGRGEEKKTSDLPSSLSSLMSTFSECIQSTRRMTIFSLFGLKISSKIWSQLVSNLAGTQVSTVCINYCELADADLGVLFQTFGVMSKLRVLDLSHNKITDGYLVSRIISKQAERRDVSKWEGGLRGSIAEIPTGLLELYLNDNLLADLGWEKILSSLISDNWLRLIDCKQNNITSHSLKQTLKVMKENKSLLVVDLRFNINFDRGFLKVMEIVDRNFDSVDKNSEACSYFTQLFEIVVNELDFPSVCEVRFVRNMRKKLKIKGPLESLDRKLNSTSGKFLADDKNQEKARKKAGSVRRVK